MSEEQDIENGKKLEKKQAQSIPDSDSGSHSPKEVQTGGVNFGQRNVIDIGRDVIGEQIIDIKITEETAYNVSDLPNPYLGLRSFTYADRGAYAGRESLIRETVERLTDPASRQAITFITGASGSGKSSFAQAGLLPALETHYQSRQKTVRIGVFRPSTKPLAMLGDALEQLSWRVPSVSEMKGIAPKEFGEVILGHTPENQVNLLVIDQFEELFTRSEGEERDRLILFLSSLPPFDVTHTHILATLRSDYLKDLFEIKALWDLARNGIELRGMRLQELKDAIQRPLQAAGEKDERYQLKRFEPGLVDRLAEDAAVDITYLPLLQVTLLELWNKGGLRLEAYQDLTAAISERADKVHEFIDFDSSQPTKHRPEADKDEVLSIFLDLVAVSLDDDPSRDARLGRDRDVLEGNAPKRKLLIDELVQARLLSTRVEKEGESQIEEVEIIHDTLIRNWGRLKDEIDDKRLALKKRSRFELNYREWLSHEQSGDYLLFGIYLKEASELDSAGDIALKNEAARNLLEGSLRKQQVRARRDILQRGLLAGSIGGGAGFSLGVMVLFIPQAFMDVPVLWPLFGLIYFVLGFLTVGLITSLGVAFSLTQQEGTLHRFRWLLSCLGGALGFSLGVVFFSLGSNTQGENHLILLVLEGILWGAVSGASVYLGLTLGRPRWLALLAAGLVGGVVFTLAESFAHAFLRFNPVIPPALWQYFLAGALVPVFLLLALSLAKLPEAGNP